MVIKKRRIDLPTVISKLNQMTITTRQIVQPAAVVFFVRYVRWLDIYMQPAGASSSS